MACESRAQSEPEFKLTVDRQTGTGDVYLHLHTRPNFRYSIERSPDLATWEPTGIELFGVGQVVDVFVQAGPPASTGGPPPTPVPSSYLIIRAFNDGTALVGWTGSDGQPYQVLDQTDLTGGSLPFYTFNVTDSGPVYGLTVLLADSGAPLQDYSNLTVADLPPAEVSIWNRYLGGRDELLAAIAAPPASGPQNGGNATPPGPRYYFRGIEHYEDADGDGLYNHEEDGAGTDPLDPENIDLSVQDVRLLGRRGQREDTIINGTVTFGAANTRATYLYGVTVDSPGVGLDIGAGAAPRIVACTVKDCPTRGATITGAAPTFLHCLFETNGTPQATGAALEISGGADVQLGNCTLAENFRTAGGGQLRATGGAQVHLINTLAWTVNLGAQGAEIVTAGGTVTASHCNIREASGTFPGAENLNADPLPLADGRLARTSPCVDAGDEKAFTGFRFLARADFDSEGKTEAFGSAGSSPVDIGADEYVSRLAFPTRQRFNDAGPSIGTFSEVDEASGVAFLGTLPNGNAKIAVVNDEVVQTANNGDEANRRNDISFYEINAATGEIGPASYYSLRHPGAFPGGDSVKDREVRDIEGITYDDVARVLYVTCSLTKRNRYRNVEPTPLDPLVDPPSNDYDPRRTSVVRVTLDAALSPTGKQYWTSEEDLTIDRHEDGLSPSPVGYESPLGLTGRVNAALAANPALGSSEPAAGVLVAWNTVPKFGDPVDGVSYPAGAALPYADEFGGAAGTAGTSLGEQVYQQVGMVGLVHNGRAANTRYFYKIWAYDAARNYTRGITAEAETNGIPVIKINEIKATGPDWVEFFNPAGVAVSLDGVEVKDVEAPEFSQFPDKLTIGARMTRRFTADDNFGISAINLPWKLDKDGDGIFLRTVGSNTNNIDQLQFGDQDGENTTGRVWDGGPRGLVDDMTGESDSALFAAVAGSPHPPTENAANHGGTYKFFQATADVRQDRIYLHWNDVGYQPAVEEYSPKQGDFHPVNLEGIAYRGPTEMAFGLRSPLTNRDSGDAYVFRVTNVGNFLPVGGWNAVAGSVAAPVQLDLGGRGVRGIEWCPTLNGGGGCYLIVAGPSNGGPLKNETGREPFGLFEWDGANSPHELLPDLSGYAVRPESVEVITVGGEPRILFVEDRFKATGYDTRNAIHWPLSILD